jgi:hypothetical protein
LEKWLEVNAEYAKVWPNITIKKDHPPDAKEFDGRAASSRNTSPASLAPAIDPEPRSGLLNPASKAVVTSV